MAMRVQSVVAHKPAGGFLSCCPAVNHMHVKNMLLTGCSRAQSRGLKLSFTDASLLSC